VDDKTIPEGGNVVDHKIHLLSQREASKTEISCKTEKKKKKNSEM
jgi:hypothetical protein